MLIVRGENSYAAAETLCSVALLMTDWVLEQAGGGFSNFILFHYCHTVDPIFHSLVACLAPPGDITREIAKCISCQVTEGDSSFFLCRSSEGGVNKTTETLEIAIQYPRSKYQAVDLGKLVTSKTFAGVNSTRWPFLSPQVER